MALELKGLKGESIMAATNISRLTNAYRKFNTAAPAHAADVESLTPQIEAMSEDLQFATQVLGNSVAASNASTEAVQPPQPPPVTFTLDPAKVIEQPPAAPPVGVLNGPDQRLVIQGLRVDQQPTMRGDVQLIRS